MLLISLEFSSKTCFCPYLYEAFEIISSSHLFHSDFFSVCFLHLLLPSDQTGHSAVRRSQGPNPQKSWCVHGEPGSACLCWPPLSIPHVVVIFSSLTSGDPPRYCKLYSHQERTWIRTERSRPIGEDCSKGL